MPLISKLFRGDPKLEAAALSAPAHITPGSQGLHVNKIQQALIEVDGADIDADGSFGPHTAAAVLAYKRRRNIINRTYQTQADDIVGIMTITALDKEMETHEDPTGKKGVLVRTERGDCSLQRSFPGPPSPTAPSGNVQATAIALLPQVRTAIRSANFNLLAADPFVTHQKQKLPTDPFTEQARTSLLLLDRVFDFFKFDDPRPVFDNFLAVYRNMDVALNRSYETAPLIAPLLFVANPIPAMESKAAAYTSHGAAFVDPKELNLLNQPANRIYLCQNLLKPSRISQTMTLVHELAHYVSGPRFEIVDNKLHGHYFAADPPDLTGVRGSVSPQFQTLASRLKVRNAEHYAAFAVLASRNRLN